MSDIAFCSAKIRIFFKIRLLYAQILHLVTFDMAQGVFFQQKSEGKALVSSQEFCIFAPEFINFSY